MRSLTIVLAIVCAGRAGAVDVPFSTPHTIDGAFDSACGVHSADVDGDGDLDVLGAAGFADDITWWENLNGSGTSWTEHTIDGNFNGAESVHAADVDGDGDLDVLGTALADGEVTWWENLSGAGTSWTAHTIDGDFDGATSVYAADMDGDGDLDVLAAALSADDITWWENLNGIGTSWAEHTIDGHFQGAHWIHAADVDGDGDLDALGAAWIADDITWWENLNGTGTSWTTHTIGGDFDGAYSVHAGDVDGDGDLDVLGAAIFANDITWWENLNGAGTSWMARTIDGGFERAYSVHAADVDGDGDLDVLGAADTADDITWWENLNGTGVSWAEHTIDGGFDGANSVYAADVDGDGDLDVLGAAYVADDITWWENKTIHRNGVFPARFTIEDDFTGAYSVRAADLDGDGDLDVLGGSNLDGIAWWENLNGAGTSWTARVIDDSFYTATWVFAADMDGDGDLDALAGRPSDTEIGWWENLNGAGTSWTVHKIDDYLSDVFSIHPVDMDGDGDIDVLSAARIPGEIKWWENLNGAGTSWTGHTVEAAFYGAFGVQAADLDGDGDLDVVAASFDDHQIAWWENLDGSGTVWTMNQIQDFFQFAVAVDAADLDGDGDFDVVGASSGFRDINWWENADGTGTSWVGRTLDAELWYARWVRAADLDADGDLDVLATGSTDDDIRWYENLNGAFTSWSIHTIDGDFDAASSVDAADVDGDGDLDVVGSAQLADDIAWWENRGGQFALPTTSIAVGQLVLPAESAVLEIDAVHNGRAGDTDVALVTFELLFDDGTAPLTTSQANDVIGNLLVYRDNGSGVFEPASDFLVVSLSSLSLTAGVQQVSLADGNTDAQVVFDAPRRYFVVLDLVSAGLVNRLRVTHLTESSSTGEDRDHDIPLKLEFSPNTATPVIELVAGPGADCPPDLVRANQTLSGTQDLKATSSATLGPNLIISGEDIAVNASEVSILAGTSISGVFSVGNSPDCP